MENVEWLFVIIKKMNRNTEKEGIIYILANTFLAGTFPVIAIIALKSSAAMVVLLWSTFFAMLYFAFLLTLQRKWGEIRNIEALKDALWTVAIIGVAYQMLFFFGLSNTTAGNASIMALSEIFFSFLFFCIWKKEYISGANIFGSFLIVVGALIILLPALGEFHYGDLLILSAVAVAPVGNFFQRRARTKVSGEMILFLRSFLSLLIFLVIASFFSVDYSWDKTKNNLLPLIINGVIMLGIMKSFWLEAIHRISVVKANAFGTLKPIVTLLTVWIFMHSPPTKAQLFSLIPISIGIFLLNYKNKQIINKKEVF